jgi:hypothetical protein
MHPSPPPTALGSLTGDLTAASACHPHHGPPPRAPSGQIGPSTMIPYPRPCLATLSPSLNQDPGGEPPRGLTGGRARPVGARPLHAVSPPFLWHMGPRHDTIPAPSPRCFPRWRAEWAASTRGRALARARWAKNPPPSPVSSEFPFLFHFFISFSYFHIYIHILIFYAPKIF